MSASVPSPSHHPPPKLHLSTSTLPPYICPTQPPSKKTPFRQINSIPYIRSATLILPSELYDLIIPHITSSLLQPRYAKVICPLFTFLDGPLFNHIKQPGSNLLAISEGIPSVDDKFLLLNGKLRLDLSKDSYQRSGLQGEVVKETGARRHVKSRWRVGIDLRAPSSAAGKKGFKRLRSAASPGSVLGDGRCWLVCDAESVSDGKGGGDVLEGDALGGLHPTVCDTEHEVKTVEGALVPDVLGTGAGIGDMDEEEWWELAEWFDLVALGSSRLKEEDTVDPYISRYSVPEPATKGHLRVLKWDGLLSSEWLTRLSIEITRLSRVHKSKEWVAFSATGHRTEAVGGVDGYTIVLQPGEKALLGDQNGDELTHQADNIEMDEKNDHDKTTEGTGLQNCICFQFLDSVVA